MKSKIPKSLDTIMKDWHKLTPGSIVYEIGLHSITEHEVEYIEKYSSKCKMRLDNHRYLTVKEDSSTLAGDKYGNNSHEVNNRFFVNRFKAERARTEKVNNIINKKRQKIENIQTEIIKLKNNL